MDRDNEQLNLLAIFHYVIAGLAGLFSFFSLIFTAVGVVFIFAARHATAKPGEELPPEFLGWIFALGSALFVIGIAMGDLYSHRPPIACDPQTRSYSSDWPLDLTGRSPPNPCSELGAVNLLRSLV